MTSVILQMSCGIMYYVPISPNPSLSHSKILSGLFDDDVSSSASNDRMINE
jgi:hypothetical protein